MKAIGQKVHTAGRCLSGVLFGRCFASCVPAKAENGEDKELTTMRDDSSIPTLVGLTVVETPRSALPSQQDALDAAEAAQHMPPPSSARQWRWNDRLSDDLPDDFFLS